jgi:hypothetical protein
MIPIEPPAYNWLIMVLGSVGLRDHWQLIFSSLWLKLALFSKAVIIGSWPSMPLLLDPFELAFWPNFRDNWQQAFLSLLHDHWKIA